MSPSATGISKEIGETIECQVHNLPCVSMPEVSTQYIDAVVTGAIDFSETDWACSGKIPADAALEIKSAAYRINDGERRGRFYIKKHAHDYLCEHDGYYLFLVHDFTRKLNILAGVAIEARIVDALNMTWYDAGEDRAEGYVAQIPWARVIEPDDVPAPDGGGS